MQHRCFWMDLDQTKHGWRCTLTKIWPRISPCSPLWFRKSKVRCCSSAAVSAFGSPVHLAWAALSLDLRQWHAWKCRNVVRNVPMVALRKSIKNSTCAPKISMEMMWAISKSPPWWAMGPNQEITRKPMWEQLVYLRACWRWKLVLESAWFNFGVRKLVFGIWAMCHFHLFQMDTFIITIY